MKSLSDDDERKARALEFARRVMAEMRERHEAEAAARAGVVAPEPAPDGVDEISQELRECRARRRAIALARFPARN